MEIRAVLFDLGNTLTNPKISEITVFKRILTSFGIPKGIKEIETAIAETRDEFSHNNWVSLYGQVSYIEFWRRWDSLVLKRLNVPKPARLGREVASAWFKHMKFEAFPNVKKTLLKLKSKSMKIGIVSNGYEEEIRAILALADLQVDLFDVIVGADTVNETKPNPSPFLYALKKLGVAAKETLFVGDSIDDDYRGAQSVGIRALLMQREEKPLDNLSDANRISSLDEIFQHI